MSTPTVPTERQVREKAKRLGFDVIEDDHTGEVTPDSAFLCPAIGCIMTFEVSEDDPDSSFSETLRHIKWQHTSLTAATDSATLWPLVLVVRPTDAAHTEQAPAVTA